MTEHGSSAPLLSRFQQQHPRHDNGRPDSVRDVKDDGRELALQAARLVLLRCQDENATANLTDGPEVLDLRLDDRYLLVLTPGDETTTVEVRNAITGAHVETVSAGGRELNRLATEIEDIYERHAGPGA